MRETDLSDFLEYDGDPVLDRFRSRSPFTEDEAKEFIVFQRSLPVGTESEWLYLAVVLESEEKMIGTVCMNLLSRQHQHGEVGWHLNPAYHGQGFATEAASALLEFGFAELDWHRISARCYEGNKPSLRLMERLGMRREALLRETACLMDGEWHNEYGCGILKTEWDVRPVHYTPGMA